MSGEDVHLRVRDLDFAYGALQILFGVDLEVHRGERVALLGTNGAGKSTLLRVVAGLLPPAAGTIELDGADITGAPAEQLVGRGMALIEGGRAIFPSLSVLQNLRLGGYLQLGDEAVDERVEEALELFPRLRERTTQPAGTLSGGEQQMVALGRALVTDPQLLLVDELSLGLAPVVLQDIAAAVEQLTQRGLTLLLVEQSLNVATALTERAYFMEKGQVQFSGPTGELLERGDLVRSVFFGAEEQPS